MAPARDGRPQSQNGRQPMSTFDMIRKAASMRKEMKQMQKNLAKYTASASFGAVTALARGDMTIAELKIDTTRADMTNVEVLQKQIVSAVNNALGSAQKVAASEMAKSAGGMDGLASLIGS